MILNEISLKAKICAVGLLAIVLGGCGGSDSNTVVSGVAATGKPVAGGAVTIQCATGVSGSTTTSSSGDYSISVDSQAFPCILEVTGGTVSGAVLAAPLHSLSVSGGVANITPFSEAVVAKLLGQSGSKAYAAYSPSLAAKINEAAVQASQASVSALLTSKGINTSAAGDLLRARFAAVKGDPYDSTLDALATLLTSKNLTLSALVDFIAGLTTVDPLPSIAVTLTPTSTNTSTPTSTPISTPTSTPTSTPPVVTGPTFGKATAFAYVGIYKSLAGNHDADVVSCVTDAPFNTTSGLIDFSKGTPTPNLPLSVGADGAISFGDVVDPNTAGTIKIFTQQAPAVEQVSYSSGLAPITIYTPSDGTGDYVVRSFKPGNKVTGCKLASSFVTKLRSVDVSARLQLILGNGLTAACGSKTIRIGTDGTVSVNGSTPTKFDFATESKGTFFPSAATYAEQRYITEAGNAADTGFFLALVMPVTISDSTLEIDVNSLVITNVSLGGAACTPGS